MSRRITISIPDDLYDQLQLYKNSFNVSKLCQKAIEKEIKKKIAFLESIKGQGPKMSEVIKRLIREKNILLDDVINFGRRDGIRWTKAASYFEIQSALKIENAIDLPEAVDGIWYYIDKLHGYPDDEEYDNLIKAFNNLNPAIQVDDINKKYFVSCYWVGFKKGIDEFWEEVKDKIE
jgi:predicted CopG family antitoxin